MGMSKYSDYTTVGGQVLAHRVRMMGRSWYILFVVGKVSFFLAFFINLLINWRVRDIWNYLCILKAVYRNEMSTVSNLFSRSYLLFSENKVALSDYVIAKTDFFLKAKVQFEEFLIFDLKVSFIVCFVSILLLVIISNCFGKFLSNEKELIFGNNYVDKKVLKGLIKDKSDIKLAGIPYPKGSESKHTIILGTTGSGKTTVLHQLIRQIIERGDRAVIVDTVGTFVNDYYDCDRDILLNPLDKRSVSWSLFKECGNNLIVLRQIADCFIRKKSSTETFWDEAAKIVLVNSLKKSIEEGRSEQFLLKMLIRSSSDWEEMLKNTPGASLMDKEVEKMALSIRATLINDLNCLNYLKLDYSGKGRCFLIKDWIKFGKGILFLSCTTAQRASLTSLLSSWLTVAAESMLQIEPTNKRTWFIIDEFHCLGRLPRFETYLAEIRKFGGCFVLGTQMISQLNDIYSKEVAKSITGLCGTKIIMNVPEPTTAQYMGEFLGKKEEISVKDSISCGSSDIRDGVNVSENKERREIVTASEIMSLKTGEAFVRFSGIPIIGKVQFDYEDIHII